jgi:FHA domain
MSDDYLDTMATELEVPLRSDAAQACLVYIYPRGPDMGCRYALKEKSLVIGRGDECDVQIGDHSVSRWHARIQPGPAGVIVEDLQSTNGTFVNDQPVTTQRLQNGDYLRIGNCIFRFLTDGNVETAYHEELYRLTIFDALTGVHNKRYFLEFLDRELARSTRIWTRRRRFSAPRVGHARQVGGPHRGVAGSLRRRGVCRGSAGDSGDRRHTSRRAHARPG